MAVAQPVAGPGQPGPAASPRHGRRRAVALAVAAAAVIAAVVVWLLAGKRYSDAVADLAPAPVGCDTTVEFDARGTYTFFVETEGSVGEIEGDCGGDDREYRYEGDALPRVSITVRDGDGEEVDLDRVDSPTYDRGGAAGRAVRTAVIEAAGTYTVTVDANDENILVRIGRDPGRGVGLMRAGAGVLLLVGLVALGVALFAGRRRPAPPAPAPTAPWLPGPGRPVAPPYAHQPPHPPYSWPPTGPAPRPPSPPPLRPLPPPGSGRPLPPPTR